MVERGVGVGYGLAVAIDQPQAGFGVDAADARDARGGLARRRLHRLTGRYRRGEDQFIVVAASERAFVLLS